MRWSQVKCVGTHLGTLDSPAVLRHVTSITRRARDARRHTWLCIALLGTALLVGLQIEPWGVPARIVHGCIVGLAPVNGHGSCVRPIPLLGPVTALHPMATAYTGTGQVLPVWSLGTAQLFWDLAIGFVLALMVALRHGWESRASMVRSALVAIAAFGAGMVVECALRANDPFSPTANSAAVGVVIGVVVIAEGSRALGAVGVAYVVTVVVLTHFGPAVTLERFGVVLGVPVVAQAAGGLVLIAGGLALRWWSGSAPFRSSHDPFVLAGRS